MESLDISSFMSDSISTDGELLLDLYTGKEQFLKTSPVDVVNRVLSFFKSVARIETSDGGKVIKTFCDITSLVLTITKEE